MDAGLKDTVKLRIDSSCERPWMQVLRYTVKLRIDSSRERSTGHGCRS
jgi:hypothetical protein